jgi:hypothetical protein
MACVECGDKVFLPDGDCSTPEVCSEFGSTDCVIYTGPSLPNIGISNGDRLSVVLKKLLEIATNFQPCLTTTTSTTTLPTTTTSTSTSTTTTVAPTTTSTTQLITTTTTVEPTTTSTTTELLTTTTSTTTIAPTTTTTVAPTTTTTIAPTTTSTTTVIPGYQYYTLKTVNCGNCEVSISSLKAVAYDKILSTGSYFKVEFGQYAGVYIIDLVLDPSGSLPQLDITGYTIFSDQNGCTDACNS